MPRPNADALTDPRIMKKRKPIAEKALNGDIHSIEQLGQFAKDTLLEYDVKVLIQVFLHFVLRDSSPASCTNTRFADDPLDSMLSGPARAALRALHQVYTLGGVANAVAISCLCSAVNSSEETWTKFWNWSLSALVWCLRSGTPISTLDVTGCVDSIIHTMTMGALPIRKKLSQNKQLLRTVVSLWLTDVDRQQTTSSISRLFPHVFAPQDFLLSLGFAPSELGNVLVDRLVRLRDGYVRDPGPVSELALSTVSDVMTSLCATSRDGSVTADILTAGAMPAIVTTMASMLNEVETLAARPARRSPITHGSIFIIKRLVGILSILMTYGPPHIVEAVQAGVLDVLVRLGIVWERNVANDSDNRTSEMIAGVLAVLRHGLYHRRVFHHIERRRTSFDRIFTPAYRDKVPYASQLVHFVFALEQANTIKSKFNLRENSHLCDNPDCPRKGSAARLQPKECSNCRSNIYCSKSCQKAAWPRHREMCGDTRQAPIALFSAMLFIPLDVVCYYQHTIWQIIADMKLDFVEMYCDAKGGHLIKSNRSVSGAFVPPTHMVKVEIDARPMRLCIVSVADVRASASDNHRLTALESALRSFERGAGPYSVLACATFSVGLIRHTIVSGCPDAEEWSGIQASRQEAYGY